MVPAILSVAREVQDHINMVYDTMANRLFNIDSHRFDIKQETIAKSGFWVSKKRYAQWIINDNTVQCDKLDVKGLDVKRSSFPKHFGDIMNDILLSILKDTSKSDIDSKILNYKSNIINQKFETIAKNSAVKDMSKYMQNDMSIGRFMKGTPAHVKSAIAYNQMLKEFKCDYKYEPIGDGDKVKFVYLKNNPYGLEQLAFTGYNDPPEISNFIETYIDADLLWEKELKNKIESFYDAMGWDLPNESLQISKKFFDF